MLTAEADAKLTSYGYEHSDYPQAIWAPDNHYVTKEQEQLRMNGLNSHYLSLTEEQHTVLLLVMQFEPVIRTHTCKYCM